MILVDKTAKTLLEGVSNMMAGAKEDYIKMSQGVLKKELTGYAKEQVDNWDKNWDYKVGQKYIKVTRENGVFGFIMMKDYRHFKRGDILKAAGYNAPALNSARGNVLTGNYYVQWTGPLYMDTQRRLRG